MFDSKDSSDSVDAEAASPEAEEPWSELEAQFRVWTFRVYHDKCFANEIDNTLRFAKALAASCRPIRNRDLVYQWYRDRRLRCRRHRTRHGIEIVPA